MGQRLDFWLDKLDIDVSDMAFQLGKCNLEVLWFQGGSRGCRVAVGDRRVRKSLCAD